MSYKRKQPMTSTTAAQRFASSEIIDELKCISHMYREPFNVSLKVNDVGDS